MRIFGDPARVKGMLQGVGMREGEAIESKLLTRQIERAQKKVEAHNFDARKNLLEYDDVANDQRRVIYQQRNQLMQADDVSDSVRSIRVEVVDLLVAEHIPPESVEEQWDLAGLSAALEQEFGAAIDVKAMLDDARLDEAELRRRLVAELERLYEEKIAVIPAAEMRQIEKQLMLQQLDLHWKEHLAAMDYLRQGIHLRGYAQKNPKQEYKREAFEMFGTMLDQTKRDVIGVLSKARIRLPEEAEIEEQRRRLAEQLQYRHEEAPSAVAEELATAGDEAGLPPEPAMAGAAPGRQRPVFRPPPSDPDPAAPFVRGDAKVGRNDPCPCGSGKKFKQCHGRLA
jgi:preprotein translocase subunit SecA